MNCTFQQNTIIELFRGVERWIWAIKTSFFDTSINCMCTNTGGWMRWFLYNGCQSVDLLYIPVTNLISYLVVWIEFKCKINRGMISKKIFVMAGMNVRSQIEKKYFGRCFPVGFPYNLPSEDSFKSILKQVWSVSKFLMNLSK